MEAIIISTIGSYLIGSFNPAYLLGLLKGEDIRKSGSHNAGASNALIHYGKKAGAICAVLDILKAYLVVRLAAVLFPDVPLSKVCAGSACILGHIFPVFMNFRGGKGLACTGGTVLAYSARLFCLFLAISLILVLVTDYICFVPTSVALYAPIVYGILTGDHIGWAIFSITGIIMIFKHRNNFVRIMNGTEAHFSFIWRRDEEIERVQRKEGI